MRLRVKSWPRRFASGMLFALIILVAAGAAAAAKILRLPWWSESIIAGFAFIAGLLLDPIKSLLADWVGRPVQRDARLRAETRLHDRRGRIRRIRKCREGDALALGVKRALYSATAPSVLPPYVLRGVEAAKEPDQSPGLSEALAQGGLVIIEGGAGAGKTRTAFEAMRRQFPDHWLIVPDKYVSLHRWKEAGVRLSRAVVWLDDIDGYLAAGGLDGAVLDAFCPPGSPGVVMLATLRSEAHRQLRATAEESQPGNEIAKAIGDILRRAEIIQLDRNLTPPEIQRAQARRADPRIAAALDRRGDVGFAEYLAAAPAILQRWQSACHGENPTAGAIISAAIYAQLIAVQMGLLASFDLVEALRSPAGDSWVGKSLRPVSAGLLEALYACYLPPREVHRPGRPTFREALAWALQPVSGASSCLMHVGGDAYHAFDYLVDHTQATARAAGESPLRGVPAAAWSVVVRVLRPFELAALESALHQAGLWDVAESAYRHLVAQSTDITYVRAYKGETFEDWLQHSADAGHPSSMFDLGMTRYQEGQVQEAEHWYQRAADRGHAGAMNNLGILRCLAGDAPEAERWHRRAADLGHADAMNNLAIQFYEDGKQEKAQWWWQRAAETGEKTAQFNLRLTQEPDQHGTTRIWYRKGPETWKLGQGETLIVAGSFEHDPHPEQFLRQDAEAGDSRAMVKLGEALDQTASTEEATAWYRRAADAGNLAAMMALGARFHETGNSRQAGEWWRRAADLGDSMAMYNLGVMYREASDNENTAEWWRRAADHKNPAAMYGLGILYSDAGDKEDARRWWQRAAYAGHTDAMLMLGLDDLDAGRVPEAEAWLWRAANAGNEGAMLHLAVALHQAGRPEEAAQWAKQGCQRAINETKDPGTLSRFGQLLQQAACEAETEQLWRCAVHAGSIPALHGLCRILLDNVEVQTRYRRAAESGDSVAMAVLGLFLEQENQLLEAERWYRQAAETGAVPAMFLLANRLNATNRNDQAEDGYRRAADAGHIDSKVNLGARLHETGRDNEAQQIWQQAAESGSPEAMKNLGVLSHKNGNDDEAARWWRQAAGLGNTNAMLLLGLDDLVAGRVRQAQDWFERAAQDGDTNAMTALGLLHKSNHPEQAEYWFRRAADAGNRNAMRELGQLLRDTNRTSEAEMWLRRSEENSE